MPQASALQANNGQYCLCPTASQQLQYGMREAVQLLRRKGQGPFVPAADPVPAVAFEARPVPKLLSKVNCVLRCTSCVHIECFARVRCYSSQAAESARGCTNSCCCSANTLWYRVDNNKLTCMLVQEATGLVKHASCSQCKRSIGLDLVTL